MGERQGGEKKLKRKIGAKNSVKHRMLPKVTLAKYCTVLVVPIEILTMSP